MEKKPNKTTDVKRAGLRFAMILIAFLAVSIFFVYLLAQRSEKPSIVDNAANPNGAGASRVDAAVNEVDQSSFSSIEARQIGQLLENAKKKLLSFDSQKQHATIALHSSPESIREYVQGLGLLNPKNIEDDTAPNIEQRIADLKIGLTSGLRGCTFGDHPTTHFDPQSTQRLVDAIGEWEQYRDAMSKRLDVPEPEMNPEQVLLLHIQTLDEKIAEIQNNIIELVSKSAEND